MLTKTIILKKYELYYVEVDLKFIAVVRSV